jgi:hypothetical protein
VLAWRVAALACSDEASVKQNRWPWSFHHSHRSAVFAEG